MAELNGWTCGFQNTLKIEMKRWHWCQQMCFQMEKQSSVYEVKSDGALLDVAKKRCCKVELNGLTGCCQSTLKIGRKRWRWCFLSRLKVSKRQKVHLEKWN